MKTLKEKELAFVYGGVRYPWETDGEISEFDYRNPRMACCIAITILTIVVGVLVAGTIAVVAMSYSSTL